MTTTIARPLQTETVTRARAVEQLVTGQPTSDGAGRQAHARADTAISAPARPVPDARRLRHGQPDDYIGGFPDHPHRGFETVTYMIAGQMRHRDSFGHEGLLRNGGVQWMTAGSGIVHSELPEQADGRMEGFQLWLNLRSRDKMRAPWYRDIQSAEIPEFTTPDGVTARVIAGRSHGVGGAMEREVTEPLYLDLQLPAGGEASRTRFRRSSTPSSTSIAAPWISLTRACRRNAWRF
jgi:redox-sensitive bicupin YhaK (pirin superfamily)